MNLACVRGRQQEYEDLDTKKRYWSVSEVLTALDPNAFAGVDPFILEEAQQRGTDLHVIFGLLLLAQIGLADRPSRPVGVLGQYFDAMALFATEHKPKPRKVEQSGVNEKDGVAGTADTQCELDDDPTLWLIDLKTGPERACHSAQLVGGYKYLSGYEKSKRFASLYIRKTGTYKLVEHTHNHIDRAWFLGGVTVLNGRKYHGIR